MPSSESFSMVLTHLSVANQLNERISAARLLQGGGITQMLILLELQRVTARPVTARLPRGLSATDLAGKLGLSRPTVSIQLKELSDNRWALTLPPLPGEDRRCHRFGLSAAGVRKAIQVAAFLKQLSDVVRGTLGHDLAAAYGKAVNLIDTELPSGPPADDLSAVRVFVHQRARQRKVETMASKNRQPPR